MNDRKKICFFAPNLAGGGAERVISILSSHFAEKGYKVDLVLAKAAGPYLVNIHDSVKVIDLKCKKVLFSLPKLVRYLRKYQPSILFTSQMHSSTIALWAVKLAGVKTRTFIRQPTMLRPSYDNKSWNSKVRQKAFLTTAGLADKVIVTSETMAKEFQSLSKVPKDRIEIIYNPVPIKEIEIKSFEPIEHPWFKKGKPPVILAVGRLTTVKDFETLIKAFATVQEEMPAHLMILGEGALRAKLEQLVEKLDINEVVQMPGFVENPYKYMKHADVFVLSSLWEGFPNGMIEAMACGTAIVATDCDGGASEILEHGKWGALVPVANEQLMARAIIRALFLKEAPSGVDRVESFSVERIFEKYNDLFDA